MTFTNRLLCETDQKMIFPVNEKTDGLFRNVIQGLFLRAKFGVPSGSCAKIYHRVLEQEKRFSL